MKRSIMKTGISLAAALAVSSAHAIGFVPPFHIDGPYTGKLVIQSSGSCKIKQTYENAQWGQVYDSNNANVGWGLITADGELLGVLSDFEDISGFSDKEKGVGQDVYFEDLDSEYTMKTLSELGSCTINELISGAKTRGVYNYADNKNEFAMRYYFNGISPMVESTKGSRVINSPQLFSGKITFKGNGPL